VAVKRHGYQQVSPINSLRVSSGKTLLSMKELQLVLRTAAAAAAAAGEKEQPALKTRRQDAEAYRLLRQALIHL